jgi:hypothetical protein
MTVKITRTANWYKEGELHEVGFKKKYDEYQLIGSKKKILDKDCVIIVYVPEGSFYCPEIPQTDFALETSNLMVIMAYHNLTHPR